MRLALETLEDRRMLSVTLNESEPNNTPASADVVARMLDADVKISGKIATAVDRDWFQIKLKPGDVIGAALQGQQGLDPAIRLINSSGELMIGNDDDGARNAGSIFLPAQSPLPANEPADTNAEFYYVIRQGGTYFMEVAASADASASTGKYKLELKVARPGIEAEPVGARQILYLDFDGATVDFRKWTVDQLKPFGKTRVAPLAASLASWGLTAADENAVIDQVIARVTDKLSTRVRSHGLNGDYDVSGRPGDFDIEIRNSRDNQDRFGRDPLVARVAVGAFNNADISALILGASQYDDVGNFVTDDDAVASVDFLAEALAFIPIQPPETVVTFVAEALAVLVAHEAGHNFGCNHTDQPDIFEGIPNVMDPDIRAPLGPDFIWGSEDDVDVHFGADQYWVAESFRGLNDTLNTIAFGLATGKGCEPNRGAVAQMPNDSRSFERSETAGVPLLDDLDHSDRRSDIIT